MPAGHNTTLLPVGAHKDVLAACPNGVRIAYSWKFAAVRRTFPLGPMSAKPDFFRSAQTGRMTTLDVVITLEEPLAGLIAPVRYGSYFVGWRYSHRYGSSSSIGYFAFCRITYGLMAASYGGYGYPNRCATCAETSRNKAIHCSKDSHIWG